MLVFCLLILALAAGGCYWEHLRRAGYALSCEGALDLWKTRLEEAGDERSLERLLDREESNGKLVIFGFRSNVDPERCMEYYIAVEAEKKGCVWKAQDVGVVSVKYLKKFSTRDSAVCHKYHDIADILDVWHL